MTTRPLSPDSHCAYDVFTTLAPDVSVSSLAARINFTRTPDGQLGAAFYDTPQLVREWPLPGQGEEKDYSQDDVIAHRMKISSRLLSPAIRNLEQAPCGHAGPSSQHADVSHEKRREELELLSDTELLDHLARNPFPDEEENMRRYGFGDLDSEPRSYEGSLDSAYPFMSAENSIALSNEGSGFSHELAQQHDKGKQRGNADLPYGHDEPSAPTPEFAPEPPPLDLAHAGPNEAQEGPPATSPGGVHTPKGRHVSDKIKKEIKRLHDEEGLTYPEIADKKGLTCRQVSTMYNGIGNGKIAAIPKTMRDDIRKAHAMGLAPKQIVEIYEGIETEQVNALMRKKETTENRNMRHSALAQRQSNNPDASAKDYIAMGIKRRVEEYFNKEVSQSDMRRHMNLMNFQNRTGNKKATYAEYLEDRKIRRRQKK